MCQELDEELEAGGQAAQSVVDHVKRMGAANVKIPVTSVNDAGELEIWEVTAAITGVVRK